LHELSTQLLKTITMNDYSNQLSKDRFKLGKQ